MPRNAIVVTVDANTAALQSAMLKAERSTQQFGNQCAIAQKRMTEYEAAVAKFGATSNEATAAQVRLASAMSRATVTEQRAAIEAQRAGEIQAAAAQKAAAAQEAAAAKQAAAYKKVGTIAGGVGLAVTAAFALSAKAAADFNAKIAQLTSLLPKTERDLVPQLAAATKGFTDIGASASDAADAEIELVKAGISAKDIMGGALSGALNLAAAGQIDFGTATAIAASAMTQFQLKGSDIPHVADLLAAGADRALGSVQDLGEGMTYAGLGAHQLGISVDDTVAALAEFANAGLIGSQGGTTLQQVLRQLTGPTDKAAEEIQALGLQLYDANGKFVGLASVAGQLHDKLGDMSQANRDAALNTLFTSRAVRGATILYQDGAKGVEAWQKRVEQSGFAADQARGKMDSLQGDLQKLGAEFENTAIDIGQKLQPALRTMTQDLTSVIKAIDNLPDPVKSVGVEFGLVVATLGLGAFAFTRMRAAAISLAETLGVLAKAQATTGATAVTMAAEEDAAAASMGGAGAASGIFGRLSKSGALRVGGGTAALLGGLALGQFASQQREGSVSQGAASVGSTALNVGGITALISGIAALPAGALAAIFAGAKFAHDHPGPQYVAPRNDFANGGPGGSFTNPQFGPLRSPAAPSFVIPSRAQSTKVLAQLGGAPDNSGQTFGQAASAAAAGDKELASAAHQAQLAVQGLTQAQLSQDKAFQTALGTQASLTLTIAQSKAATEGLSGVMNKAKTAINTTTVAGATLVSNMIQIAQAAPQTAEGISRARAAIISQSEAAGASAKVAHQLANELLNVKNKADALPSHKTVNVDVNVTGQYALDRVAQSLSRIGSQYHTGVQVQYADGGYTGPGGKYEPAGIVHRGEFVFNQSDVNRIGLGNLYAMTSAPRFADGGYVGGSQTFRLDSPALTNAKFTLVVEGREFPAYLRQTAKQVVNVNTAVNRNVAAAQAAG